MVRFSIMQTRKKKKEIRMTRKLQLVGWKGENKNK